MSESSAQEKTEQPTSKRLQDSRDKGQVARSRELNTMLIMLIGASGLLLFGNKILQDLARLATETLTMPRKYLFDDKYLLNTFSSTITEAVTLLTPFLILMVIVAMLAPLLISGWTFSLQALGFKWDKLNPIKGLGRIFAWTGVVELLKALAKFALVLTAVSIFLWSQKDDFMLLAQQSYEPALASAVSAIGWSFLLVSLVLIIVAMVDVPFQIWNHTKQLKMTKQEIRDENKETEGNPEVRGRVRQMQQEISKRRMMDKVPTADVIITNPTHFAVALKYNQDSMKVPIVVAKGADLIAQQIRNIGSLNEVPVVEAPQLARSLFYSVELDQEIPAGLYLAVAQLLAYVYQLNNIYAGTKKAPAVPDFPIPDELRRDE